MKYLEQAKKFKNDEEYYNDYEFITNSQLGWFEKSPMYYEYRRRMGSSQPTQAMVFGDAFHKSVLEPDKFKEEFVMAPNVDRRTKKGKEEWAEFVSSLSPHQKALTANEYDDVYNMTQIILSNPTTMDLLSGGEPEKVMVWDDPTTNVPCKGKLDYVREDCVIDLKTTRDCSKTAFLESCIKYGYIRQAAFYCSAAGVESFIFIAIEKTPPYIMNVFQIHATRLEQGRVEFTTLLERYSMYEKEGTWNKIIIL